MEIYASSIICIATYMNRCFQVNRPCVKMLDSKNTSINHANGIAAWTCISSYPTFHLKGEQ
jgi:hypothetical protein